MDIAYERPEESDLRGIEELLRLTYSDTFQKNDISTIFEIDEEVRSKLANVRKDIIEHNNRYYFLVARLGKKVVGICAYFPVSELIRDNVGTVQENDLEIGCTYIHPGYQGMGIGSRLFAMTIAEMRSNGVVRYYLSSGFETSQEYWRKKIGEPVCVIGDIWGTGKHELVWRMDIA